MNEYNIPMIAYIFVGVTSFVLAYATYSESNDEQSSKVESTPLPAVFPSNSYPEEEMVTEESEETQNVPVIGGKSKKTKSKKSKLNKSKSKKTRTKYAHHHKK